MEVPQRALPAPLPVDVLLWLQTRRHNVRILVNGRKRTSPAKIPFADQKDSPVGEPASEAGAQQTVRGGDAQQSAAQKR